MLSLSMDVVLQPRLCPDDASFGVAASITSYPPQSWCGGLQYSIRRRKNGSLMSVRIVRKGTSIKVMLSFSMDGGATSDV